MRRRTRWSRHGRSLATKATGDLEIEIARLTAEKDRALSLLSSALSEQNRRAGKRTELAELRDRIAAQGQTVSLFGIGFGHSRAVKAQLESIDREISSLESSSLAITRLEADVANLTGWLEPLLTEHQRRVEQEQRKQKRAETQLARERSRMGREKANASLAARVRGTVRSESSKLRAKLRRDHPCPYCGRELGEDMQADHIHPVSKGGLPTLVNYVMTCRPCNGAKRDMTLNQFIDHMGLNREVVIRSLRMLGKDA